MEGRRRRPFVAALLSFVVFGLGDAYNGFTARGARLLAAALGSALVCALAWSALAGRTAGRVLVVLFVAWLAVPTVLRLYGAARAWRDARRLRDNAAAAAAAATLVIGDRIL